MPDLIVMFQHIFELAFGPCGHGMHVAVFVTDEIELARWYATGLAPMREISSSLGERGFVPRRKRSDRRSSKRQLLERQLLEQCHPLSS